MHLWTQILELSNFRVVLFIFLLVSVFVFFPAKGLRSESVLIRVIDGDTLEIADKRFRIFGIDAPEKNQMCTKNDRLWACGIVATGELIKLVIGQKVSCAKRDTDQYKRVVAVCFTNEGDIGSAMVASGWALAHRQYSMDYAEEEAEAKSKKLGLWASQFVMPWQWRRKRGAIERKATQTQSKPECLIKGNISSKGDRVYHKTDDFHYDRTKIDLSRGEKWFCSITEAEKAGWRAPIR